MNFDRKLFNDRVFSWKELSGLEGKILYAEDVEESVFFKKECKQLWFVCKDGNNYLILEKISELSKTGEGSRT